MSYAQAGPHSAAPQPGELDAAGLRRAVAVLSTVQIVSWGVLYYAFAALQGAITTDTGWSSVAVTGAFSLAQLVAAIIGVFVGRHIDAAGPRKAMTAFSLVAVPGLLAVALAPDLTAFYLGWVLTGAAMAGTLYPPAFAALTRWGGAHRVRALTTLTLVAGLASTVFAPLASALASQLGWRIAYLVLLALLVAITVPLHWWGLRHPWPFQRHPVHEPMQEPRQAPSRDPAQELLDCPMRGSATRPAQGPLESRTEHAAAPPGQTGKVAQSAPFLMLALANGLTSLAVFAVVINMVPMLVEQGMSTNLAALTLGLGGVGQVVGRLGYARFASATSVTSRGAIVLAAVAATTAALALAPYSVALLILLGMLLGLTRGIYTLIQATAVTDRWGPASYGTLNGILTAPAMLAAAAAPFAGAALSQLLGSYAHAFLALAGLAGTAAALMLFTTPRNPSR